jgi:Flp pilus assembly protein TadG
VVEIAVTLPVFVLILFATIETTTMIFLQQSLEISAYQGARIALIPSANSTNVTAAVNQVLTSRDVNSASVTVVPSDSAAQPYGTNITVRVSAPCNANSPFSPWFYGGRTLTGEVTMMKEY